MCHRHNPHILILATSHQYEVDISPGMKKTLADNIWLGLEIHTQLEEKILYPASQAIVHDEFMQKSASEHDGIRWLSVPLRSMTPGDASCDQSFSS